MLNQIHPSGPVGRPLMLSEDTRKRTVSITICNGVDLDSSARYVGQATPELLAERRRHQLSSAMILLANGGEIGVSTAPGLTEDPWSSDTRNRRRKQPPRATPSGRRLARAPDTATGS